MSRLRKLALALALLLVLLGAAVAVLFWKRPLAVLAWSGRRRLEAGGCSKQKVASAAGPQTVFRGGSGPAVVLLHGAGDQAGTWAGVAPSLAKSFTLILPDLAGHGESAPARGPLPLGALLEGLDSVLERQAPAGKVTLVGNSLGAWIAALWAKEHPARVEHLVFVNGGPIRKEPTDLTLMPRTRAQADALLHALRDPTSPVVPTFVVDDLIRVSNEGPIARLAADAKGMEAYLLDGKLDTLTVPVDLVWGASDTLLPLAWAERLQAQLPAARLTKIDRCGHVPQQECPEAFAAALSRVLRDPLPAPTVSSPPTPSVKRPAPP
ncbi:MAG TPA: alpha/beta hydrolase [Thermoanaerobaculia bacterium]|nr:alpha/beta hydrolase [Thermoanaerobaculia bacterium]